MRYPYFFLRNDDLEKFLHYAQKIEKNLKEILLCDE